MKKIALIGVNPSQVELHNSGLTEGGVEAAKSCGEGDLGRFVGKGVVTVYSGKGHALFTAAEVATYWVGPRSQRQQNKVITQLAALDLGGAESRGHITGVVTRFLDHEQEEVLVIVCPEELSQELAEEGLWDQVEDRADIRRFRI